MRESVARDSCQRTGHAAHHQCLCSQAGQRCTHIGGADRHVVSLPDQHRSQPMGVVARIRAQQT